MGGRRLARSVAAAALATAAPAMAQVDVSPRVSLRQVLDAGLGEDDTVTYTEAAAGVSASVDRERVDGVVSYDYRRRFFGSNSLARRGYHSGLARGTAVISPSRLWVDAGAAASLRNRDFRSAGSLDPDEDNINLAQTYSGYVSPRFRQRVGSFADFDATYRLGFVELDERAGGLASGGGGVGSGGLGPDDRPFAVASDGYNQSLQLVLGNRERSRRVRYDLIGTAIHDDLNRLDQRYRAYTGRFETEFALNTSVSLLGSVGYEDILNTTDPVVLDEFGQPVIGPDSDFVIDPDAPRRVSYSQEGLVYDGGVRLTPSPKLVAEARAGKRYGGFTFNGSIAYRPRPSIGFTASWSDSLDSFGRLLTQTIGGVSTSSVINGQAGGFAGTGCIFGLDPGTGTCLFDAIQSITDATFKSSVGQAIVDFRRNQFSASIGLIYSGRRYLDTQQLQAPGDVPLDESILGRSDRTYTLRASARQNIGGGQTVSATASAARYQFALSRDRSDEFYTLRADYIIRLSRNLDANADVTLSHRTGDFDRRSDSRLIGAVGVRYSF